jgi:hypothetical protein
MTTETQHIEMPSEKTLLAIPNFKFRQGLLLE